MYKKEGYWDVTPRDSCPEVIHIEQILGNYQNYAHEAV